MLLGNIKILEHLNGYASLAGIVNIFLGLLVIFVDTVRQDWMHLQVGVYIFITGYAFVKISEKIWKIIEIEKKRYAEMVSNVK